MNWRLDICTIGYGKDVCGASIDSHAALCKPGHWSHHCPLQASQGKLRLSAVRSRTNTQSLYPYLYPFIPYLYSPYPHQKARHHVQIEYGHVLVRPTVSVS